MEPFILKKALGRVRVQHPLVHCITNYVTVNDCANALLALGASPIMSDEPDDVSDITSICGSLVLNIGTLNNRSIEGMRLAAARAGQLNHPIVLDPVGAGASALRTQTASMLLDGFPVCVVRGNMSEIKALAGAATATRGVDVNPNDVTTEENLQNSVAFARAFANETGTIVAITGTLDIVADAQHAFVVRNGVPRMGYITGAGCMLTGLVAAFVAANPSEHLEAVLAAVVAMGLAGQIAQTRMASMDGNGSFRTYVLDALTCLDGESLEAGARVEVCASGE